MRWLRDADGRTPTNRKSGRPRTAVNLRELVLRMARENGWGYTRILGELKKVGLGSVCRSTVANILKEAGIDTGPKRGPGTWSDFLERHLDTLWACDFLSVRTATTRGMVDLYVLFFIHPQTRRVIIGGVSPNPDAAWVRQQARNATMVMEEMNLPVGVLVHDRDGKFGVAFDSIFEAEGAIIVKTVPRSPNMNAFAERFAQILRHELLDHFVIFGERHLLHLLSEFCAHYHHARPHQGLGNVVPCEETPPSLPFPKGGVRCETRLGGFLKSYHRVAA